MFQKQSKPMYCPNCFTKLCDIKGSNGNIIVKCKICKKYVKYNFRTEKVEEINKPERKESSGTRFY